MGTLKGTVFFSRLLLSKNVIHFVVLIRIMIKSQVVPQADRVLVRLEELTQVTFSYS